jgi:hypothetical protein
MIGERGGGLRQRQEGPLDQRLDLDEEGPAEKQADQRGHPAPEGQRGEQRDQGAPLLPRSSAPPLPCPPAPLHRLHPEARQYGDREGKGEDPAEGGMGLLEERQRVHERVERRAEDAAQGEETQQGEKGDGPLCTGH